MFAGRKFAAFLFDMDGTVDQLHRRRRKGVDAVGAAARASTSRNSCRRSTGCERSRPSAGWQSSRCRPGTRGRCAVAGRSGRPRWHPADRRRCRLSEVAAARTLGHRHVGAARAGAAAHEGSRHTGSRRHSRRRGCHPRQAGARLFPAGGRTARRRRARLPGLRGCSGRHCRGRGGRSHSHGDQRRAPPPAADATLAIASYDGLGIAVDERGWIVLAPELAAA